MIEVSVKAAEDPVKFGDLHGDAYARGDFIFGEVAVEVGGAEASD